MLYIPDPVSISEQVVGGKSDQFRQSWQGDNVRGLVTRQRYCTIDTVHPLICANSSPRLPCYTEIISDKRSVHQVVVSPGRVLLVPRVQEKRAPA